MATLQDCTNQCYAILRENPAWNSAYPLSVMQWFCEIAQTKILNGLVVNPFPNGKNATRWQLPFINVDLFYVNVQMTTINVECVIGDTSLFVASVLNYPDAGTVFISGAIITYTSVDRTNNIFLDCSPIPFPFLAGTWVSIAFKLPDNYANIINVTYNNQFKLLPMLYDSIFEMLMDYKLNYNNWYDNTQVGTMGQQNFALNTFYTTKDDEYLLVFNINANRGMIYVRYQKLPDRFTMPSDASTIPDNNWALTTIPYLAVGEMLYNRGEEQRASDIMNYAITNIQMLYDYYNNTSYENVSGTKFWTGKKHLNF